MDRALRNQLPHLIKRMGPGAFPSANPGFPIAGFHRRRNQVVSRVPARIPFRTIVGVIAES